MNDAEVAVAAALAAVSHSWASLPRNAHPHLDEGGVDFATDIDIEAEHAILDVTTTNRPDDRIVAEESGLTGDPDARRRSWLVDPICGTLNFAAGTGPVAINVALRERDSIVAAAVVDPLAPDVNWSDRTGAWRRFDERDVLLEPTAMSRLVDLNIDASTADRPGLVTLALIADPQFAERFGLRVVSTSIALAWVASGQRAAYITDGNVADSVHFAAGIGLCKAAGCVISDLDGHAFNHRVQRTDRSRRTGDAQRDRLRRQTSALTTSSSTPLQSECFVSIHAASAGRMWSGNAISSGRSWTAKYRASRTSSGSGRSSSSPRQRAR